MRVGLQIIGMFVLVVGSDTVRAWVLFVGHSYHGLGRGSDGGSW